MVATNLEPRKDRADAQVHQPQPSQSPYQPQHPLPRNVEDQNRENHGIITTQVLCDANVAISDRLHRLPSSSTQREPSQRDIHLLQAHHNGLNEVWKRFDETQFNIEELDESEEARRYTISNDYYAAVALAHKIMYRDHPTIRGTTTSPAPTVSAPITIRLPEIRLPTFDGTIEKWASFFDIFPSIIDRNEDLMPVQKLQYLRSTLTGKAAVCIQSLSTTDANYTDAIELLKEKFDCMRRIILQHCDALQNIPKLAKDSPEALGNLVNTIRQHLRALKNLGESVSSWNSILVSIILSKVSSDITWHWELTLTDRKRMPLYSDLLDILEKRASCAPVSSPAPTKPPRPESPRIRRSGLTQGHAFLSTDAQQCRICQGGHGIWTCGKFQAKSAKERITAAENASFCSNCLKGGHTPKFCWTGSCRICHKRHHTLLRHPKHPQYNTNRSVPAPASPWRNIESADSQAPASPWRNMETAASQPPTSK
ncbi:hypothetical protein ANTPLA_LOCUS4845 [Anthophora plagiata]